MTGGAAPEETDLDASMRELSGLLWRERIALDRLADRLAGVAAELGEHVSDVDTAGLYHSISALELHRAIATREAALDLGLDGGEGEPTLEQLVQAAPPGWADALASHRRALIDLTTEVGHLVRRPVVDIRVQDPDDGDFPVGAVRRYGVQRSLRDFLS